MHTLSLSLNCLLPNPHLYVSARQAGSAVNDFILISEGLQKYL